MEEGKIIHTHEFESKRQRQEYGSFVEVFENSLVYLDHILSQKIASQSTKKLVINNLREKFLEIVEKYVSEDDVFDKRFNVIVQEFKSLMETLKIHNFDNHDIDRIYSALLRTYEITQREKNTKREHLHNAMEAKKFEKDDALEIFNVAEIELDSVLNQACTLGHITEIEKHKIRENLRNIYTKCVEDVFSQEEKNGENFRQKCNLVKEMFSNNITSIRNIDIDLIKNIMRNSFERVYEERRLRLGEFIDKNPIHEL